MAGSWDLSFAVELNAEGWHGQQASKDLMTYAQDKNLSLEA